MKKIFLILVVLALVLLIGFFVFVFAGKRKENSTSRATAPPNAQDVANRLVKDEALKNTLNLYTRARQEGVDFSNGPCLGIVAPDWVADITHNPRQPLDDEPENQCADFREGRVHHFIELDLDGKLIRVY